MRNSGPRSIESRRDGRGELNLWKIFKEYVTWSEEKKKDVRRH